MLSNFCRVWTAAADQIKSNNIAVAAELRALQPLCLRWTKRVVHLRAQYEGRSQIGILDLRQVGMMDSVPTPGSNHLRQPDFFLMITLVVCIAAERYRCDDS